MLKYRKIIQNVSSTNGPTVVNQYNVSLLIRNFFLISKIFVNTQIIIHCNCFIIVCEVQSFRPSTCYRVHQAKTSYIMFNWAFHFL